MRLERAKLEDYLRDYYFDAEVDISSSGVEPYDFAELKALTGIDPCGLIDLSFRDSRSAGSDQLRRHVADRCGIDDPSRVIVANGSTEAQLLVLMSCLSPGDQVVVVHPGYHSLVETVSALGCEPVAWRLLPEAGFRPDLDALERIVGSRTRMIIVNFPHNPTEVTLTAAEQLRLVDIAARHDVLLFWDGAFEDLVFDRPPLPPIANLYANGLSFGSMSKSFGLPGLRVGWGILPSAAFVDCAVAVRDYTTLALSPIIEWVAAQALQHAEALIEPRLRIAADNRSHLLEWLAANAGSVSCDSLDAGVVAFLRLLQVPDTEAFCHRVMEEHRVLLIPGECFGAPGYVRLGFGGQSADLHRGLEALAAMLAQPLP